MFSPEQIDRLQAPIDPSRVKQRRQAGRPISYLEGYDVIDAANAVFGFDGWSYAVQDVQFVRMNDVGFYQAIVKVRVGDVERTDVGCCDIAVGRDRGIDSASADAYGTALKGAVTDGLKRSLRTFGNQFGNSLYDSDDPAHAAHQHPEETQRAGYPRHSAEGPHVLDGGSSTQAGLQPSTLGRGEGMNQGDGSGPSPDGRAPCPTCGGSMTLRSGTTRDGRPYTAWFCDAKCGQKPLWLNERKAS